MCLTITHIQSVYIIWDGNTMVSTVVFYIFCPVSLIVHIVDFSHLCSALQVLVFIVFYIVLFCLHCIRIGHFYKYLI